MKVTKKFYLTNAHIYSYNQLILKMSKNIQIIIARFTKLQPEEEFYLQLDIQQILLCILECLLAGQVSTGQKEE